MPCLQAVVRVCDLATAATSVLFSAFGAFLRLVGFLKVMPCLQAVVRVCDLAIAAIRVLFTALTCVAAGWWNFH